MITTVTTTICPGCNYGCSLYLREGEDLNIDFRKASPVNAGKLCRFGVNLPIYYRERLESRVKDKPSSLEEAIKRAAEAIGKDTVFLSPGDTTCEEQLALQGLADQVGGRLATGLDYTGIPQEGVALLKNGIPYQEIETAGEILLLVDPYTQYPLVLRNLLRARGAGAKITSVWYKHLALADKSLDSLPESWEGLIISDFHPFTRPEQVKGVLSLGGKPLFLKAHANTTGAQMLHNGGDLGLVDLLAEIEAGKIRTLYCLESDPFLPGHLEVLDSLETLIYQGSHPTPLSERADIVIAAEPFYQKTGILVNSEGRVQRNTGSGFQGVEIINKVNQHTGGSPPGPEELTQVALEKLGVPDENTVPERERPAYPPAKGEFKLPSRGLVMVTTPFTWHNQPDPKHGYLELNPQYILKLKLQKGGSLTLNGVTRRFRPAPVKDENILSYHKLPLTKELNMEVEVAP